MPHDLVPRIAKSQRFSFALLLVAYFLAALLGTLFYTDSHTFPGILWPAAAVGMGGLVLGGRTLWPAIFVGALGASLLAGTPLLAGTILAVAHTVQAVVGAWFLQRFRFDTFMSRLGDAIALSGTGLLATTIVPTIATITRIYITHTNVISDFWSVWGPIWVGQIFAIIVIMPVIVRWLSRPRFARSRVELLETAAALATLALVNIVLFWTPLTSIDGVPLVYLILFPFFWIALRIGPRFMTVAVFMSALLEVIGTIISPSSIPLGARLFEIEIFAIIISFIFLVIVAVVEERKDANNALKEEVEKLERALARIRREEEAKNQFIAVLAHELRNPLAPIVSAVELVGTDEKLSVETKRWLSIIGDHANTMRRLLDDLLDVSRVSQQKLKLVKETVDLRDIVRLSLDAAVPLIESKRHRVMSDVPDEAILVEADPMRLEQIVVNLLTNAARYTEPGGMITVSTEKNAGTASVSVKDTGIGIAPEIISRIFEPFVQVGSQKAGAAGLGIGLSLTKQLATLHGGSIEARSGGLGSGSEFIVRLPLSRTLKQIIMIEPEPTKPIRSQDLRKYRMLVVDDNEAAAEALGRLLEYRGHDVNIIHQGGEVVAFVREHDPEVIILDIGLPDLDGYEVARRLRNELDSHALLIALTGYGQHEDKEQAKAAGFDHHLTKPIGLDDIEVILARTNQPQHTAS